MSSGYVIASVTVTNPEQYEEYKKWSTLAMQAHGAEVAFAAARWKCWKATGTPAAPCC